MHIVGVKKKKDDASKEKNPKDVFQVPRNMQLAYKYTLEGCNLGNIYCCANLSQMYARGDGNYCSVISRKRFRSNPFTFQA